MPGSPEEQRGGLSGYSCVNEEAPLKDEIELGIGVGTVCVELCRAK